MHEYEIGFYRKSNGECPFEVFLEGRNPKIKKRFIHLLDLLKFETVRLSKPYSNALRDGIRDLRIGFEANYFHALYFFSIPRTYVFTHGVISKSGVVSEAEIDKAIRFRKDFSS